MGFSELDILKEHDEKCLLLFCVLISMTILLIVLNKS